MTTLITLPASETPYVVSAISCSEPTIALGTFSHTSSSDVFLRSGESMIRQHHNFPIADLAINGGVLVTVSDHIRVFNHQSLTAVVNPHGDECVEVCPFTSVNFCAENNKLFVVSDVKGNCSVWSLSSGGVVELVQLIALSSEILYSATFVTEQVIACVSESGHIFVFDRRSHTAVCAEAVKDILPPCQPRIMSWMPRCAMVAVGHQISGNFSIFEIRGVGETPRIIGTSPTCPVGIAGMTWIQTHPQYIAIVRDDGKVEVWNSNNFSAPHFDFALGNGGSAIACTIDGALLVGTDNGEVIRIELPNEMITAPFLAKFDDEQPTTSFPALE